MILTKLEQAREEYIILGNKRDQAWDKYIHALGKVTHVREKYKQVKDAYIQACEKYHQTWDKYTQARDNLLELEIEHILATKISI